MDSACPYGEKTGGGGLRGRPETVWAETICAQKGTLVRFGSREGDTRDLQLFKEVVSCGNHGSSRAGTHCLVTLVLSHFPHYLPDDL